MLEQRGCHAPDAAHQRGTTELLPEDIYSVSQKITPPPSCDLRFSVIFSQTVKNFKSFLRTYYTFLSTLDYKFLLGYLKF